MSHPSTLRVLAMTAVLPWLMTCSKPTVISLSSSRQTIVAPPSSLCGGTFNKQLPTLTPALYTDLDGPSSDAALACLLWQTFVYLNWPSASGSPGQPDLQAAFDGPGPVVWETYAPFQQVFLPKGQRPAPWGQLGLGRSQPGARRTLVSSRSLQQTEQVDGGKLVDQASRLVYYELLLNEDEFNYILENTLYEASAQSTYARDQGIRLPTGASQYGNAGTIELKSAWKVLTQAELTAQPVRFHTAQATLPDSTTPVTVGLVGLHIYQRITDGSPSAFEQGIWTSFAQIDNAPLASMAGAGTYSFNNPSCAATDCPANKKTKPPTPTQVTQVFTVDSSSVAPVNQYMQQLIASSYPDSPWQFYQMLGVQWPRSAIPIGKPGQLAPLPNGSPSIATLINPVLETFLQQPGSSCLGCHVDGRTSTAGQSPGTYAASYSFLLGHAQAAP